MAPQLTTGPLGRPLVLRHGLLRNTAPSKIFFRVQAADYDVLAVLGNEKKPTDAKLITFRVARVRGVGRCHRESLDSVSSYYVDPSQVVIRLISCLVPGGIHPRPRSHLSPFTAKVERLANNI